MNPDENSACAESAIEFLAAYREGCGSFVGRVTGLGDVEGEFALRPSTRSHPRWLRISLLELLQEASGLAVAGRDAQSGLKS